jgi:phosphatidylethanolamine/phosphatidyl-N-methylethanolamine N-methyltransferase
MRVKTAKALRNDPLTDNLRFLRALIARPKQVGAVAPSSRMLARAIADEVDPLHPGPVLELGPGTGAITQALLERGVAPERLTTVEYDADFALGIARRFPGVTVVQGDAFDLDRTLGTRHNERFAAIVSGIPLLNFPIARRRAYVEALMHRLLPGAPLIQFSYGMHAPTPAPRGHSVTCTAMIWANLPPARVWVYRKD